MTDAHEQTLRQRFAARLAERLARSPDDPDVTQTAEAMIQDLRDRLRQVWGVDDAARGL